ncbi:MAG: hypothetical protein GF350_02400 [Chitinivibrionales bacterium]|nr:hypothetical protein [Chitinivibrionales bacterium]
MKSATRGCMFVLAFFAGIYADITMGSELFCDHMVLQREKPVRVWGAAANGEQVTVSINGNTGSSTASNGEWEVMLDAMSAGGPYEMTVEGNNTLTFSDVMVGEVIFGGGQSNMVVYMGHQDLASTYSQAAQAANYPRIRLSQHSWRPWVPSTGSPASNGYETLRDKKWHVCTPDNAMAFSALLFYVAKKLHEELNVPVGVIDRGVSAKSLPPFLPALDETMLYENALMDFWQWRLDTGLPEGIDNPPGPNSWSQDGGLYSNVETVLPYTMRAIVWWQGENEMSEYQHNEYRYRYPALISAWRRVANQGVLPFIGITEPNGGGWESQPWYCPDPPWEGDTLPYADVHYPHRGALMYEAFLLSVAIPNVYMASALGLGGGSHPGRKEERAERVANTIFEKIFGQNIISEPPLYDSYSIEQGNRVRIKYRGNTANGLYAEGSEVKGFCINSETDSTFVYAQAQIDGPDVLVWNDNIADPKAVRYGWTGRILECATLCNSSGLQAYPFRTDVEPLPTDSTATIAGAGRTREKFSMHGGSRLVPRKNAAVYDLRGRVISLDKKAFSTAEKYPTGIYFIPYNNRECRIFVAQ